MSARCGHWPLTVIKTCQGYKHSIPWVPVCLSVGWTDLLFASTTRDRPQLISMETEIIFQPWVLHNEFHSEVDYSLTKTHWDMLQNLNYI